jgi:hypothetical protein
VTKKKGTLLYDHFQKHKIWDFETKGFSSKDLNSNQGFDFKAKF